MLEGSTNHGPSINSTFALYIFNVVVVLFYFYFNNDININLLYGTQYMNKFHTFLDLYVQITTCFHYDYILYICISIHSTTFIHVNKKKQQPKNLDDSCCHVAKNKKQRLYSHP